MEDEFSLGEYLAALRRRWYVIPIAVALTLVLALVYNMTQDARYKAEAVLTAEPAKYVWRLDQAFQGVAEDLRLDRRADYTVLLTERAPGTALAQQVIEIVGADTLPPNLQDPKTLWEQVEVKNGRGRVVYLAVSAPRADLAITLANAWAEAWRAEVSLRYGQASDLVKFQAALAEANDKLATTRRAVQDLQARTGLSLELGGQMTTLQEGALAAGLTALQQEIVLKSSTLAEYQVALDRLRAIKTSAEAAGASFSLVPLELLDTPLLVQRGQLTREQVDEMGGDINVLLQVLAREDAAVAQTVAGLQAEIAALQSDLAAQIQERNTLLRQYNQAEEAARALERKVTEIGIQESIAGAPLMMLGIAEKATPTWIINLLLAGAVGVLGGVLLAFGVDLARKKA